LSVPNHFHLVGQVDFFQGTQNEQFILPLVFHQQDGPFLGVEVIEVVHGV